MLWQETVTVIVTPRYIQNKGIPVSSSHRRQRRTKRMNKDMRCACDGPGKSLENNDIEIKQPEHSSCPPPPPQAHWLVVGLGGGHADTATQTSFRGWRLRVCFLAAGFTTCSFLFLYRRNDLLACDERITYTKEGSSTCPTTCFVLCGTHKSRNRQLEMLL